MTMRVMLAVVAAASVAASVNAQVQKRNFPGYATTRAWTLPLAAAARWTPLRWHH
jgi:hypothetical protein